MPLNGVHDEAFRGMRDRETGGVVIVKGEECAYMFPHEIEGSEKAKNTLSQLLSDNSATSVIYVLEERDSNLHLLAYPVNDVKKSTVPPTFLEEEEV